MTLRPSSLPMLAQCPCWESDQSDEENYKGSGNARHDYLTGLLQVEDRGNDGADIYDLEAIADHLGDDSEGVEWAAGYIKSVATASEPLVCEQKLSLAGADFETVMEGTPDVTCGNEIFDLKWRERDYDAQMAAYALMLMQARGYSEVTVHILFAERRQVKKINFNWTAAEAIVFKIVHVAGAYGELPTPCDYCGWCANRLKCPALTERANAVAAGREDWKLEQWHTSEVNKADEVGKMLALARALKPWIEAAEYHALEFSKANEIPGFRRQERRGAQEVKDIAEAHRLSGLPGEQFIRACKVSIPTLAEIEAEVTATPKAAARKAIEAKLAPVIERRPSSFQLVKTKDQ